MFFDLNFETLQDIPPIFRHYDIPWVSVSKCGRFSMNGALKKEAGDQRAFRAKLSPDGRYLVLYPGEAPNVRFSAKGCTTHRPLAQRLGEFGFLLPVVYTMEWCQDQMGWVGCCAELPKPPSLSALSKPGRTKSGRKAAKGGSV